MTFRPLHGWLLALSEFGWLIPTVLVIVLAAVTIPQYNNSTRYLPKDVLPGSTTKLVPATGEQGFPVEAFCNDGATRVVKGITAPPDSTFSATYNLDRTLNGVHEVVTVGVWPDANRQPVAMHYDSLNVPTDAFVSKAALACIKRKGGG